MVDLVMVPYKERVTMVCYVMEMEPAKYLKLVSTPIPHKSNIGTSISVITGYRTILGALYF